MIVFVVMTIVESAHPSAAPFVEVGLWGLAVLLSLMGRVEQPADKPCRQPELFRFVRLLKEKVSENVQVGQKIMFLTILKLGNVRKEELYAHWNLGIRNVSALTLDFVEMS